MNMTQQKYNTKIIFVPRASLRTKLILVQRFVVNGLCILFELQITWPKPCSYVNDHGNCL